MKNAKSGVYIIFMIFIISLLTLSLIYPVSNPQNSSIHNLALSSPNHKDIFTDSIPPNTINQAKKITSPTSNFDNLDIVENTPNGFTGYNIFSIVKKTSASSNGPVYLLITDMNGTILLEKQIDGDAWGPHASAVEFLNSTTIFTQIEGSFALYNIINGKQEIFDFNGHHEYEYNPINDTFFTFHAYHKTIGDEEYIFDYLREYDKAGNIVWSLDSQEFITIDQWNGDVYGGLRDICHSNTIFYDVQQDVIYWNMRNPNTFYKINHSTGEIIWALGEDGDFTLYDRFGKLKYNLFYHCHSVEKIDKNKFILFDNNYKNTTADPEDPKKSRMIEITIDEDSMTANVTWVFTPDQTYYSYYWCDADRLPNLNRLGTFGTLSHSDGVGAKLVEVNPTGSIVWEMDFPNNDYVYGVYRMERFRFQPILKNVNTFDSNTSRSDNITLTWQAWYNYRNKGIKQGDYYLYIDNRLVKTDRFEYNTFWRATNLSFSLDDVNPGIHNISLTITDGEGHNTTDSLQIQLGDFHLERNGPLQYEIGEASSLITWSGFSRLDPLATELYLNGTLVETFAWTGEDIVLDLTTLDIGNHTISLQLFNSTNMLFNDTFWLTIYPNEDPIIITAIPSNLTKQWNESVSLVWHISDRSPDLYRIYINGTCVEHTQWNLNTFEINWTLPYLQAGTYNITLEAKDRTHNQKSHTVWVTVLPPPVPIIEQRPQDDNLVWGSSHVEFKWEVFGASEWYLLRNGSLLSSGTLELINDTEIAYSIKSWQAENWRITTYNLTCVAINPQGLITASTSVIQIYLSLGDPYANSILNSQTAFSYQTENALGKPDHKYASITSGYGDGYLTLDMGEHEAILDGDGTDFTLHANGSFHIHVGYDLDQPFIQLSDGTNTSSYDLASYEVSLVRYVRISYKIGDQVYVDAIEALHYHKQDTDTDKPSLVGPQDFWIWDTQAQIQLEWQASDLTPWNYSISVNEQIVRRGFWDGSNIAFNYELQASVSDAITVSLTLKDLFGNEAKDSVNIEIRQTNPSTSTNPSSNIPPKKSPSFTYMTIITLLTSLVVIYKKRNISSY